VDWQKNASLLVRSLKSLDKRVTFFEFKLSAVEVKLLTISSTNLRYGVYRGVSLPFLIDESKGKSEGNMLAFWATVS
jgi:hypothetical protein